MRVNSPSTSYAFAPSAVASQKAGKSFVSEFSCAESARGITSAVSAKQSSVLMPKFSNEDISAASENATINFSDMRRANFPSAGENDAQATPKKYDFSNMTGSQLLEAGKELAQDGKISLDQMFQIQLASGSFGGNQSDTAPKDFIKYFREQLDGEISRGGMNNPKSMVAIYESLLSTMKNDIRPGR